MSQNQEIIEAKLCAYIDDELDAAGRAELEKHLAANPQHLRLIEELRRTSALVRNLPHESAPPELAEGFGAQLERSVLLEGVSEDVAAADLKAPRWPQLVAMAAITLLTVGLAVVVYFALPGTSGRPQIVQSIPPAMTPMPAPADDDRVADAKLRDFDKSTDSEEEKFGLKKDANAPALPGGTTAAGPAVGVVAKPSPAPLVIAGAAESRTPDEPRAPESAAGGSRDGGTAADITANKGHGPVVLVMHADDPAEARKSLVIYLVQQNIAWEPAESPADRTELARRKVSDTSNAVSGALGSQQVATEQPAMKQSQPDLLRDRELAKAAPAPTSAPSAETDKLALEQSKEPAAASTPASPPIADGAKRAELFRADAATAGEIVSAGKPEFAISCRVTTEQAEALRANLSESGTTIDALPADLGQKLVDEKEKVVAAPAPASEAQLSLPAPLIASPPATNPVADTTLRATLGPSVALADQPANLSADATQPSDASIANIPVAPTTQPANNAAAMVDFVIVVRPTDHPGTQPAAPAAVDTPTTDPAGQVAPATQPQ